MNRSRGLLAFIGALGTVLMGGCSSGDDGVDHSAVEKAQAPLLAAAKKSGGDWSKLSAADQKLFLDRAQGNEGSAKMIFGMMAKGPQLGGSAKK